MTYKKTIKIRSAGKLKEYKYNNSFFTWKEAVIYAKSLRQKNRKIRTWITPTPSKKRKGEMYKIYIYNGI